MTVSLERDGKNFVLFRTDGAGNKHGIILSDGEVLMLAQSAQSLRVLAKRTPPGRARPPVVVIPVAMVELNCDARKTKLHLRMNSPKGAQSDWFSLPPSVARSLLDGLPKWLSKMEKQKTKKH